MAGQDMFTQIALNHQKSGELRETPPSAFTKKLFEDSESFCERVEEKSYDELLAAFQGELDELRESYKHFMTDYTPVSETRMKRFELQGFQFRYEDEADKKDFLRVLNGGGDWENIEIPDYRGPVGKWTGFYRIVFRLEWPSPEKRMFIRFSAVD